MMRRLNTPVWLLAFGFVLAPVLTAPGSALAAPAPARAPKLSVLLLRFDALPDASGMTTPENAWVGQALQQGLQGTLASERNLRFVTAQPNPGEEQPDYNEAPKLARLGRLSGASVVVTGADQRSGNALRVSLHVLDAQSHEVLGGVAVTGEVRELFKLQDQLAEWLRKFLTDEANTRLGLDQPAQPEPAEEEVAPPPAPPAQEININVNVPPSRDYGPRWGWGFGGVSFVPVFVPVHRPVLICHRFGFAGFRNFGPPLTFTNAFAGGFGNFPVVAQPLPRTATASVPMFGDVPPVFLGPSRNATAGDRGRTAERAGRRPMMVLDRGRGATTPARGNTTVASGSRSQAVRVRDTARGPSAPPARSIAPSPRVIVWSPPANSGGRGNVSAGRGVSQAPSSGFARGWGGMPVNNAPLSAPSAAGPAAPPASGRSGR
jgi:TolB-like protein